MPTLRTVGRKLFVVVLPRFLCGSTAACRHRGEMLLAADAAPPRKAPGHIQGRRWLQGKLSRDSVGGPVVETRCSQCGGPRSDPSAATKEPAHGSQDPKCGN